MRQAVIFRYGTENMPKVKKINHVAVVVDDMEKALSFWKDALNMDLHELRDVPAEQSQVAFLPLPGSEVEFIFWRIGQSSYWGRCI